MTSRVVLMMTALSLLLTHQGETSAQSSTVDRSNLVLELLFDGDARDTSGNGHHGELFGPVSTDDRFGQPNAAFAFDGQNDYIRVAPPPQLSAEAFTLSVWVKYDDDAFSRYWTTGSSRRTTAVPANDASSNSAHSVPCPRGTSWAGAAIP